MSGTKRKLTELEEKHLSRYRWMEAVLAHPEITDAHCRVLLRLALHQNVQSGRCDPGKDTLAAGSHQSRRTVQYAIRAAEGLGLLETEIGSGARNTTRYRLKPKREHGAAPFKTEHLDAPKGAANRAPGHTKGSSDVLPNSVNSENIGNTNTLSRESDASLCSTSIEEEAFDELWRLFPRSRQRALARKTYARALAAGASLGAIIQGAQRYARETAGTEPRYVLSLAKWLADECWRDAPGTNETRSSRGHGFATRVAEYSRRAPAGDYRTTCENVHAANAELCEAERGAAAASEGTAGPDFVGGAVEVVIWPGTPDWWDERTRRIRVGENVAFMDEQAKNGHPMRITRLVGGEFRAQASGGAR